MGSPTTFRDAFGSSAPARGLNAAQPDHFKQDADRGSGKPDAFAGKKKGAAGAGFYNPFTSATPAREAPVQPAAPKPVKASKPVKTPEAKTAPAEARPAVKVDAPKPEVKAEPPKVEAKPEPLRAAIFPEVKTAPPKAEPPKIEPKKAEAPEQSPTAEPKIAFVPAPKPATRFPSLKLIVGAPKQVVVKQEKPVEAKRENKAGKSSSLVLVSGAPLATAMAEEPKPAPGGGGGNLEMPVLDRPKPDPKPASKPKAEKTGGGGGGRSGGGSGGGSGGSGGGPKPAAAVIPDHKDRVLNQDDLMGVAIVVALLLLLALYLFRGQGAQAPAVNPIVSTQFAATPPPPAVQVPPPDPFGDKPVDLTPKSPPPPPEVAATPPPPPVVKKPPDLEMHAFFCTAKSNLTSAGRKALEQQLDKYAAYYGGAELVVTGFADTRGANDYNSVLSGARASTVADFLKSKGMKISETTGVGELSGLQDNENCSNQRRVDIAVAGETAEPPSRACTPPKDEEELACG